MRLACARAHSPLLMLGFVVVAQVTAVALLLWAKLEKREQ
jgi:hypothetical protein